MPLSGSDYAQLHHWILHSLWLETNESKKKTAELFFHTWKKYILSDRCVGENKFVQNL